MDKQSSLPFVDPHIQDLSSDSEDDFSEPTMEISRLKYDELIQRYEIAKLKYDELTQEYDQEARRPNRSAAKEESIKRKLIKQAKNIAQYQAAVEALELKKLAIKIKRIRLVGD